MEEKELIKKLCWAVSALREEGKAEEAEAVKEAIEIIKLRQNLENFQKSQ